MKRQHRPLLPGPGPPPDPIRKSQASERKRIGVACNSCRSRKLSCKGERPVCSRCTKDKLRCEYVSVNQTTRPSAAGNPPMEQLQQNFKQSNDFIDRLLDAQEADAIAILRRLKSTRNVSNFISTLHGAAHTAVRPSELYTARAILPPTASAIEFELGMLHQTVFPISKPLDLDSLETRQDLLNTNRSVSPIRTPRGDGAVSPLLTIAGPVEDRHYCDPRFNQLKIDYWTKIPIRNEFAASVLSYHFKSYHALWGCVDFELFLSDLINHKLNYCSPFLLSAIMSHACQSYSSVNVRSSAFSVAFLRNAERLWRTEHTTDDPKNLAALCYLVIASGLYADEELRSETVIEARAMAKRMSLLDVRPTDAVFERFRHLPADKIKELSHAAWGVYGALSFLGSFFGAPPILFPPCLPVPGGDRSIFVNNSSDVVWPASSVLPAYMGRTFPTLSALWIIVQSINIMYFSTDETPVIDRVPLAFIESKYQELLAWSKSLSSDMYRGEYPIPHVSIFHALYHCTLISLLRPLQDSPQKHVHLRSFTSRDATPSALYSASVNQLKHLMVAYCTASPPPNFVIWINCAVLEIGADLIRNPVKDAYWDFCFNMCFAFWKRAFVPYRALYGAACAMLLSALNAGVVDYAFVARTRDELRNAAPYHQDPDTAKSNANLAFELALAGTKEESINALSTQLDELVLFHELTNCDGNK